MCAERINVEDSQYEVGPKDVASAHAGSKPKGGARKSTKYSSERKSPPSSYQEVAPSKKRASSTSKQNSSASKSPPCEDKHCDITKCKMFHKPNDAFDFRMNQVPVNKRKNFKFCNPFIKRKAKEMFGEDVFAAIATRDASEGGGVPEMKGPSGSFYAEVNMAMATVPSAQSFTVGDSFENYFDDWTNPMEARDCLDKLNIANTQLVESPPTPNAVDSLLTAGQLVASVAPTTAEPKICVDKACECLLMTKAIAGIRGDGLFYFRDKVYKLATPADTGEHNKANMFAPLLESSSRS